METMLGSHAVVVVDPLHESPPSFHLVSPCPWRLERNKGARSRHIILCYGRDESYALGPEIPRTNFCEVTAPRTARFLPFF